MHQVQIKTAQELGRLKEWVRSDERLTSFDSFENQGEMLLKKKASKKQKRGTATLRKEHRSAEAL